MKKLLKQTIALCMATALGITTGFSGNVTTADAAVKYKTKTVSANIKKGTIDISKKKGTVWKKASYQKSTTKTDIKKKTKTVTVYKTLSYVIKDTSGIKKVTVNGKKQKVKSGAKSVTVKVANTKKSTEIKKHTIKVTTKNGAKTVVLLFDNQKPTCAKPKFGKNQKVTAAENSYSEKNVNDDTKEYWVYAAKSNKEQISVTVTDNFALKSVRIVMTPNGNLNSSFYDKTYAINGKAKKKVIKFSKPARETSECMIQATDMNNYKHKIYIRFFHTKVTPTPFVSGNITPPPHTIPPVPKVTYEAVVIPKTTPTVTVSETSVPEETDEPIIVSTEAPVVTTGPIITPVVTSEPAVKTKVRLESFQNYCNAYIEIKDKINYNCQKTVTSIIKTKVPPTDDMVSGVAQDGEYPIMLYLEKADYKDYTDKTNISLYIYSPADIIVAPKNCENLFSYYSKATIKDLEWLDTSEVTNMESMFAGTDTVILSDNFDTSNVTNMSFMFCKCNNVVINDTFDISKIKGEFNILGCFSVTESITFGPNFSFAPWTDIKSHVFGEYDKEDRLGQNKYPNVEYFFGNKSTVYGSKEMIRELQSCNFTNTGSYKEMPSYEYDLGDSDITFIEKDYDSPYEYESVYLKGNGVQFNKLMKKLANSSAGVDEEADEIKFVRISKNLPTPGTKVYSLADTSRSDAILYMWYEKGGIYLYTNAETIYLPKNCSYMFSGIRLGEIYEKNEYIIKLAEDSTYLFARMNAIETRDMSYMFYFAKGNVKFTKDFHTENVTNMQGMFYFMQSYTPIFRLGYLDTSSATAMKDMVIPLDHWVEPIFIDIYEDLDTDTGKPIKRFYKEIRMCEYIDLGPAFTIKSSKDKWNGDTYPFYDWTIQNRSNIQIYMSQFLYDELKKHYTKNNMFEQVFFEDFIIK